MTIDNLSGIAISEALSRPITWRVLAALLEPPFVPHRQAELARALGVPEASVQRGLKALIGAGLAQRKRGQYIVSLGRDAVRYLWLLLQVERHDGLPSDLRNALTLIRERDYGDNDCVILFGSWARGVAVPGESDVDLCVFTDREDTANRRLHESAYRIEVVEIPVCEMTGPRSSVALDALVNGIALSRRDSVFDALVRLRTFPKAFLLYRLDRAKQQLDRAHYSRQAGNEEAADFFRSVAAKAIGQVRSILEHGRTASWRELPGETSLEAALQELRQRLADEGDEIWLT